MPAIAILLGSASQPMVTLFLQSDPVTVGVIALSRSVRVVWY